VIFASGPSLAKYTGKINQLNANSIIVATPTNVPWLQDEGVRIDMVVIADSHPGMATKLKGYEGPIICPPTIAPEVTMLPNDIFWYKLLMGNGQGNDPFYGFWNMIQHGMFEKIEYGFNAENGCVTNMALAIVYDMMRSRHLLCKRIILAGADYAYTEGWARIESTLRPKPLDIDAMEYLGYHTNSRMVFYKHRLIQLWEQLKGIDIYSMSEGIITEIPEVTLDDILAKTYPAQPTDKERTALVETHTNLFLDEFGEKLEDK